MANILDEIVAVKRQEIARGEATMPIATLEREAANASPRRGFLRALREPRPIHVIAEIKKASPSAGIIRADFDPVGIAEIYEAHGATCLSVLTDERFFQGHLRYLTAVREAVAIPLLRKDFILDRRQLLEAVVAGADAVLLIAEMLPGDLLAALYRQAVELGLDALVELHDAEQLPRVIDCGTQLIGINNRDLRTFVTRRELTLELLPHIPKSIAVVGESGIRTAEDLRELQAAGVNAVLVGESLMRAADIGLALDRLRGVVVD